MKNRFYKDELLSQRKSLQEITYGTLFSFNKRAEVENPEQPLWVEAQINYGALGLPKTAHITLGYSRNTEEARKAVTDWLTRLRENDDMPSRHIAAATITGSGVLFPNNPVLLVRSTWCARQHANLYAYKLGCDHAYVPHITVTPQEQSKFTTEQPVYIHKLVLFRKSKNQQRHSIVLADLG